jgi:hypothetical protein
MLIKLKRYFAVICLMLLVFSFSSVINTQAQTSGCFAGDTFNGIFYDYEEEGDLWIQYADCTDQSGERYFAPLVAY